jgi:hypothetical protein
LAGFQVIINGRFWVITEAFGAPPISVIIVLGVAKQ